MSAISEGHGDAAMVLLKAGAETDKRDVDGNLAIDLAPDKKVGLQSGASMFLAFTDDWPCRYGNIYCKVQSAKE